MQRRGLFLIFGILLLSCIEGAPSCFDVEGALASVGNSSQAQFPFVGRKPYLTYLSNAACSKDPRSVNIIVAPKDSGKSRGLALAMREWVATGALVVDIDFKGSGGSHPLTIAAEKLARDLIASIGCMSDEAVVRFHSLLEPSLQEPVRFPAFPNGGSEFLLVSAVAVGPIASAVLLILYHFATESKREALFFNLVHVLVQPPLSLQ